MTTAKPDPYEKLITYLSTGMRQRQLYFTDHPNVKKSIKQFTSLIHKLLYSQDQESYFLGVVDGKLVHEGHYLIGPSITGKHIITCVNHLNSGGLLFNKGITEKEIGEFFTVSSELKSPLQDLKEARDLFKSRLIKHIEISPVYEDSGWFGQFLFKGTENWGDGQIHDSDLDAVLPVYQNMFETVDSAHSRVTQGQVPDINKGNEISEQLVASTDGNFMDIMQLVRYPDYDSYTVGHSVRVALIAVIVAHKMGMDPDFLVKLGTAGLFHDVGKAVIPNEILYKKGKLDSSEMEIIKRHPVAGTNILLEHKDASRITVSAAWGHHVRHDGKGYPEINKWAKKSVTTSLIQICDVYEALTSVRPYKEAKTPRQAYEIMLQDHKAFNRNLLAQFIRSMTLYPPGSRVLLSNGKKASVLSTGETLEKPKIQITHDAHNQAYSKNMIQTLDLEKDTSGLFITEIITH